MEMREGQNEGNGLWERGTCRGITIRNQKQQSLLSVRFDKCSNCLFLTVVRILWHLFVCFSVPSLINESEMMISSHEARGQAKLREKCAL